VAVAVAVAPSMTQILCQSCKACRAAQLRCAARYHSGVVFQKRRFGAATQILDSSGKRRLKCTKLQGGLDGGKYNMVDVRDFGPFHHDILLPDGTYTTPDTHRVRFASKTIFPPLCSLNGGNLNGLRVLDVGCNCGGFSFLAAELGATEVVGIDVREAHIRQANALKAELGMKNVRFEVSSVEEFAHSNPKNGFDVVLLLGILYHLSDPIGTFGLLSQLVTKHVLIDSHVHYSSDDQREDMPLWWMLPDTDMGEYYDVPETHDVLGLEQYQIAERKENVDYSQLRDAFVPSPHTSRDLKIAEKFYSNPNAPGPEDDTVRSSLSAPFSLVPNKKALVKLVRAFGFQQVLHIEPPRLAEPRYTLKYRIAFLASRIA
jgi:SAM-dependent methyltransferase